MNKKNMNDMLSDLMNEDSQEKTASAPKATPAVDAPLSKEAALDKLADQVYTAGKLFGSGVHDQIMAKIAEVVSGGLSPSTAFPQEKSNWEAIAAKLDALHTNQAGFSTEGQASNHAPATADGPNKIVKPTQEATAGEKPSTPTYGMQ